MKIWTHTLVRNEEKYVWFAVESVINYIDKLLLWDTGSTDKTREIIKNLKKKYPDKICVRLLGEVTPQEFTDLRQDMLSETKSDWFIIVDGDEVWWDEGIKKTTDIIRENKDRHESIVNGYYNLVGDIFHYQEEKAGMYRMDDRKGHINIRAVNRNIPGLNIVKPHGQQGIYDGNGVLVQERSPNKRFHLKGKTYLHFTNVLRSSCIDKDLLVPKRGGKLKYDLGISFPNSFYYPESFFRPRPEFVPSPWKNRGREFVYKSLWLSPFRSIKRRVRILEKVGY